jgi:hypothetical protein
MQQDGKKYSMHFMGNYSILVNSPSKRIYANETKYCNRSDVVLWKFCHSVQKISTKVH